jgi:hypothetical protein
MSLFKNRRSCARNLENYANIRFIKTQLIKILSIALKTIEHGPDKLCEDFVVNYFKECDHNQCPDRMDLLLKNTSLAKGIIGSVLNHRFSLHSLHIVLNHTVIQHIGLFSFLTAEELIRLALCDTQVIDSNFLKLSVVKQPMLSESFLEATNIQ